ncbi:MAG: FlgO family outer membrane protein [Spirochaetales bacterium]|jgi:TolB-like protein|nr:FlgO family outer membrane protein [Spirochaetales bacterium]
MKKRMHIALMAGICLTLTGLSNAVIAQETEQQMVEKVKVPPVYYAQQIDLDPNLAILPGSEADSTTRHKEIPDEQEKTAIIPGKPNPEDDQIPTKPTPEGEPDIAVQPPQAQSRLYYGSPSAQLDIPPEPAADARSPYTKGRYKVYHYMPESNRSMGTEALISEMSREVAGKIYYELKDDGEKHHSAKVAIVGAVPLADLKRETEFGRMMAEYLLTDLSDRGIRVSELRLGKEINILAQTGEFILSRNINELANNNQELDYVVVSTFTNTRKTLILQGRMIDLKNGIIKTAWRYTLPLSRELLGLFHTIDRPYTIAVKGMSN